MQTLTQYAHRMYARTNDWGTACAETATCCCCLPHGVPVGQPDCGDVVDCTGNDALECYNCGRTCAPETFAQ